MTNKENYPNKSVQNIGKEILAVFCISPFLLGLFHEWLSALVTLLLLFLIGNTVHHNQKMTISSTPLLLVSMLLPLAFVLTSFWAVDRGMAWFGVLKFLPLPLFTLLLAQVSGSTRKKMLRTIPWTAAVMTILAGALSFIPSLAPFFLVNGRLAGFFQYPNSYAVYLLVGTTLILTQEGRRFREYILLLILLGGIAWSGSRAVMLLLAMALILCSILAPSKKNRLENLSLTILCALAVILYLLGRNSWEFAAAFSSLTRRSSTVIGRLLYDRDALPVILRHPLGLGYLGYAFKQGSFQTGVYTVTHVHNDFFQILLDIGWLPFVVCVWAMITGLRRADRGTRIAASVLLAHSLVDFDLQFVALDFVLILLLMPENENRHTVSLNQAAMLACACLIGVFSLWLGSSSFLHYIGQEEAALRIYPRNTFAALTLMSEADGTKDRAAYAEKILTWNTSCAQAYRVRARTAFSQGDIEGMIQYAEAGIKCSRYELDGYLDYFDMLSYAITMFRQVGDGYSEAYCCSRLASIPKMLKEVKETTSPLAWRITDQPELNLPEEYEIRLADCLSQ